MGFQLANCRYWDFSTLICELIPYNRSLYTNTHTHTHTHIHGKKLRKKLIKKKKDRLSVRNRRQWGNFIHFINDLSGQEKHSFCLHSFFNKYLPRTYHGPNVILGGEETSGNKVPTFKDGGGERNAVNKQVLLHAYFYEEK